MFDKLIVSDEQGAEFKGRGRYFMVSTVVVGILFVTAVVFSLYAADIGLGSDQFEPWILEVDGKKRLPVFSSQDRMQAFAAKISQDMNKVFGLGCISILLENVTKHVDVDFVDLNPFSKKSWAIGIGNKP